MKHLFIVNPAAGKGKTLHLVPKIHSLCSTAGLDYSVEVTEYPGHAAKIASKYASEAGCKIFAVGGDGTLNEVLNGMACTKSCLAVIPSGSGNDFIKSLTTRSNFENIDDIIEATLKGSIREIDLARVNGRYFLNISSLGFDANVVYNTLKFKKLPFVSGSMAYILGIFISIIGNTKYHLKIRTENEEFNMCSLLIAVANGRYYGGGMLAAPEAIVDDGLFDLCLIESQSRFDILTLFPRFIKGEHGKLKGVSFKRCNKVEIESARPISLNLDGEVTMTDRAVFEIIPKGIKMITPI